MVSEDMEYASLILLGTSFAIIIGIALLHARSMARKLLAGRVDMERRMYELAVMREIDERISYTLDIQEVANIIVGSLNQLIPYSVVSYIMLGSDALVFRAHIEKSISRGFIDDLKERMLQSLTALTDFSFDSEKIREELSGALLSEDNEKPIGSSFNIPLSIGGKTVGVLSIAHTVPDLYRESDMLILYKIIKGASDALIKLQHVVAREQAKMNALIMGMEEGMIMIDTNHNVLVSNMVARKIMKLPLEELLRFVDVVSAFGNEYDIREKVARCLHSKEQLLDQDIALFDGVYNIRVATVQEKNVKNVEQTIGCVVVLRDRTKEKHLEKMRDDFSSMMVHELRSPLMGIQKMSEMEAEGGMIAQDERIDRAKLIHGYAGRMLTLVNDLLDVAKLEAGKFEIRTEKILIRTLVEESTRLFVDMAQRHGIAVMLICAETLPESFVADGTRIRQVIGNLIANSIKFTRKGGSIDIVVFMHERAGDILHELHNAGGSWIKEEEIAKNFSGIEDMLVFGISDTGIGMTDKEVRELFTQYKQGTQGSLPGTGLGLVVVKGIVETHGGMVGVSSQYDIGTTVYFALPFTA